MIDRKPKAIITVGIPGSGKSTHARELERMEGYVVIERDQERRNIVLSENLLRHDESFWKYWDFKREKEVTQRVNEKILNATVYQQDIVIADTNLNEGRRVQLVKHLEDSGFDVTVMTFPIDVQTAIKQDRLRRDTVGEKVIRDMHCKFMEQFDETRREVDNLQDIALRKGTSSAVIVDVDGTLASRGDRRPFDWDKIDLDFPRPDVIAMVHGLYNAGYRIYIFSGRDGSSERLTRKWLNDHGVPFHTLTMRQAGDNRKDWIVKEEMLFNTVLGVNYITQVIDDRPQTCDHWRELGLNVAQVADPYLRF